MGNQWTSMITSSYSLLFFLILLQDKVLVLGYGYQYKVDIYLQWSEYHSFRIGIPSDSVIQVTAAAFASCNTTDPILNLNDGNSLFTVTSNGKFYLISGVSDHCKKNQKLHVSIGTGSTAEGAGVVPADHISLSSYPTVFGSIPVTNSSASSSASSLFPGCVPFAAIVGSVAGALAII